MPPIKDPKATLDTVAQELQKRKAATVQPSISANDLASPVAPVNPPVSTPPEPTGRVGSLIGNVTRDTQGFITNQSAEAQKAREISSLLGQDTGSVSDYRTGLNEQYGIPTNLKELQDIQLQLADRGTETKIQDTRIGAAAGQTVNQAGREVTQNQREAAIRDAGLAARAAVLQGNIETASTLVSQAVSDFTQDRSFKNQQMIQQLNYFQARADEQTGQLLEQEKRKYQEDQANIERTQNAVDAAMASGAATTAQIAKLTDPNSSDVDRLKISQEIIASSASEDRNLKLQQIRQSISSASLSAKKDRLGLCKAGDSSYCGEFNIDPNALSEEEINARINNQQQSLQLQDGMNRLEGIIANDFGLQMSSGSMQSPLVTGGLGGPLAGTQKGTAGDLLGFVPVVGNIMNYNRAKEAKEQFLGDVQYLLGNRVFEKVAEIKADGYAGAISNTELELMANASSVLNSLAIRDESGANIIGFRGGEENLKNELNLYVDIYKRASDALNIKALQPSTKNDIISVYNE